MNYSPIFLQTARLVCALFFCLASEVSAGSAKWTEIPAADRTATQCAAYPDAKAEHLFIRETITSEHRTFHQRTKLYSADAIAFDSILSIEYSASDEVYNVFARVVKPDGTSVEYARKDFKESNAVKSRDGKVNKLTASFSGLAVGDIIEMKWTRPFTAEAGSVVWGYCQGAYPTREYTTTVESCPQDYLPAVFNMTDAKVEKLKNAHMQIRALNLPPFVEEPLSPPIKDIRGWYGLFLTHTYFRGDKPLEVWNYFSEWYADDYKLDSKPNSVTKKLAAELILGASTDDEKLAKIYEWCRANITNFTYFKNAELEVLKKKRDDSQNWGPTDTLRSKTGFPNDITYLFGSLARAAGFETRVCLSASRDNTLNVSFGRGYQFLNNVFIAVKRGEAWQLFSPGDYHVPYGLLHWTNETVPYMRCDSKQFALERTTPSTPSDNVVLRKGRFSLDLDGNLEGDVTITYSGHSAVRLKEDAHAETQQSFERDVRAQITQRLPNAEVGELQWGNLRSIKFPVTLSYHVKVPAHAELLGERLVFNANFFTKGHSRLFTASTRQAAIFFDYPLRRNDDIEIILPEGYKLDSGSSPVNVIDPQKVLSCEFKTSYSIKKRTLTLKRAYEQCGDGTTMYQQKAYTYIKRLSELIDASDSHAFMCKPADAVPAP